MKNMNLNKISNRKQQSGFTIIELVVVILLLGILTATALPRFLDLSTEAHDAVVDGILGSMTTGAALYRANWFAAGRPTDGTGLGDFDNLVPDDDGFPVGTSGGADAQDIDLHSECEAIYTAIMDEFNAPTVKASASIYGVAPSIATDNAPVAVGALTSTDFTTAAGVAGDIWALYSVAPTGAGNQDGQCQFLYARDNQRFSDTANPPYIEYLQSAHTFTIN